MIDQIFGNLKGFTTYMDLAYKRNQALTSNIANAETPMYKAIDIDFGGDIEAAFGKSSEVAKTSSKHLDSIESSGSRVLHDYSGLTKADGNNVDLDLAMSRLNYNSQKYGQAANIIRRHFQRIDSLIKTA